MAEGTSFEIDLRATGAANVTGAADGVDRLSSSLQAAVASATAAADAVTAGEAAYKQAEASASKAALAVEKIGLAAEAQRGKLAKAMEVGDTGAIERARAKLQTLTASQVQAATKAAATTAAMNESAASLDKLKASASGAAASQANISKALDKAKIAADRTAKATKAAAGSGDVGAAAGALGKLGGPLGSIGQQAFDTADAFKKMSQSLGSAGPYVAIAVGLAAIVAGAVAATVAVVGATAAILKFAVFNADAARTSKLLAEQAKGGAAGLAATAKLAMSLDSQAKKLKTNVDKIFSVSEETLERFLVALDDLASLFDENSASAKAISTVFKSLFDPLLDGVTDFIPTAIGGFIQFEIQVMKAMIAIKPFKSTILMVAKVVGVLALVLGVALAAVIGVVVVGIGLMAVGFAVLATIVLAVAGAFMWVGAQTSLFGLSVVNGAGGALDWLKGKFDEVVAFLSGLSLAQIGTDLVNGLVNGIMAAGPAVIASITGLASGAISAAKKALGIASPSTIFAEIGANTAAGMEGGVDDGAGAVQSSMESMVSPPSASTGAAAGAGTGGGGPSLAGGTFNFYGVKDAEDGAERFLKFLEDLSAQGGTAVPNG